MESLTTRVDGETREEIDQRAEEQGSSVSEVTRDLIRRGLEYEDRVAELKQERDRAEARADDLRKQLAEANAREDDVQELVAYVEDERTAEQRRREAGLITRTKWWLTGQPSDEE